MIIFFDPFERIISFAKNEYNIKEDVTIRFVNPKDFKSRIGLLGLRKPLGETFWPKEGPIEIRINSRIKRGVCGSLDVLAHELAHIIAGHEADHGPKWQNVYSSIYYAARSCPFIKREI